MTIIELLNAFGSIATTLAVPISAIGIFISIRALGEMRKQRLLEYRPDVAVTPSSVYFRTDLIDAVYAGFWANDYAALSYIDDPTNADENQSYCYSVRAINLGRGVAKSISVEFIFDIDRIIRYLNENCLFHSPARIIKTDNYRYIEFNTSLKNSDRVIKSNIYLQNSAVKIHHILPISEELEKTYIPIPRYITTMISAYAKHKYADLMSEYDESLTIRIVATYMDGAQNHLSRTIDIKPMITIISGGPNFEYCGLELTIHYQD